mmetsp:Transcript_30121/g.115633  ORF Transcript_30121/g.115633 Transcript_30121/m.115633 type:complete len:80 (-) Transcript_30121:320-559(-)
MFYLAQWSTYLVPRPLPVTSVSMKPLPMMCFMASSFEGDRSLLNRMSVFLHGGQTPVGSVIADFLLIRSILDMNPQGKG